MREVIGVVGAGTMGNGIAQVSARAGYNVILQDVRDEFLDPDVALNVHVNHYDIDDVIGFVAARGFKGKVVVDRRSGGRPESVIGYPHYWTFIVADRTPGARR